jgi:type II secretory pathway pseudopilin PulG
MSRAHPASPASRARRGSRGFAYLWLLLVIALMGVGFASVLELHQTSVRRDQEQQLLWIGRQYVAAIESYRTAGATGSAAGRPAGATAFDPQQYPAVAEDLLKDPRFPGTKRHLRRIYTDPLTGSADWGFVRRDGRIIAIHSLSAAKPIKQAGFQPGEESFRAAEHYSDWVFTVAMIPQAPLAPASAAAKP